MVDSNTIPYDDPRVIVSSIAAVLSFAALAANIFLTTRGQKITSATAGKARATEQTTHMIRQFFSPQFALIRSSAWHVFETAKAENASLEPLVDHLLGRDADQESKIATLFPWDHKTTEDLSYFQCVVALVSYWELWSLLLQGKLAERSLYSPILTQHQAWKPTLNEIIRIARQKVPQEPRQPTWVKNIDCLNSDWSHYARSDDPGTLAKLMQACIRKPQRP